MFVILSGEVWRFCSPVNTSSEPPLPAPIVAPDEEEAWLLGGPILKKVRCLFAIRDDVRVVLFVTDY